MFRLLLTWSSSGWIHMSKKLRVYIQYKSQLSKTIQYSVMQNNKKTIIRVSLSGGTRSCLQQVGGHVSGCQWQGVGGWGSQRIAPLHNNITVTTGHTVQTWWPHSHRCYPLWPSATNPLPLATRHMPPNCCKQYLVPPLRLTLKLKLNTVALVRERNYTDRAAAAGRRS